MTELTSPRMRWNASCPLGGAALQAHYKEVLLLTSRFRGLKRHSSFRAGGKAADANWIENAWIKAGCCDRPLGFFGGAVVPLFIQWVDIFVQSGFGYLSSEDAEVPEAKEDQDVVEAAVHADHREDGGAGRKADARHSERLKFREDCGMLCATQAVAWKLLGLPKMKSMQDAQKAVAHRGAEGREDVQTNMEPAKPVEYMEYAEYRGVPRSTAEYRGVRGVPRSTAEYAEYRGVRGSHADGNIASVRVAAPGALLLPSCPSLCPAPALMSGVRLTGRRRRFGAEGSGRPLTHHGQKGGQQTVPLAIHSQPSVH
eukprot:gene18042-biopygen15794